jgi:hypothetical protein
MASPFGRPRTPHGEVCPAPPGVRAGSAEKLSARAEKLIVKSGQGYALKG